MSNINSGKMRTKKLFKFTLSIVLLAFMSADVFGQTAELNDGTNDLPNLSEDTDGSAVDHVTEGYIVPYYVTPDPVLNSGYTEPYVIGTADQGFGSSWGWAVNTNNTVGDGAANATIYNGGYDEDNTVEYGYDHPYVEVEWTRSADATATSGEQAYIEVREEGTSGITCTGEWNWLPVQVYAKPSFDFMDGTNGNVLNADGVIELCDDGTGIEQDILIASITDNGIPIAAGEPFENGNFKFRLDRDVYAVDASLTPLDPANPVSENIDEVVTVTASFENDIVLLSETLSADPDNDGTDQIIRYRYDFGTTIDGNTTTNNGITDPVQRKSQYLSNPDRTDADWDYIANSDTEGEGDLLTFIVYPAPSTGNIHHVPNDFDL